MRVLRLGSSIDLEGETPPEERAAAIAARMLEGACGEPVETIHRIAWPNEQLADFVERWANELEPDIVCFNVSSHWCEAELMALRLREFGLPGRWIADFLDRSTRNYNFNANWFVRFGRGAMRRVLQGKPPFTPKAAADSIEATLRRLARNEHLGLALSGSPFSASLDGGEAARQRARERRGEFFALLRETCESLHVPCDLPPHAPDAFDKSLRTRDRLHFGPEMHQRIGEIQGRVMVEAWRASAAPSRATLQ
ncbi:MAG: hypothetical protein AB7N24_00565 [Dehalococcoidia bacterium]